MKFAAAVLCLLVLAASTGAGQEQVTVSYGYLAWSPDSQFLSFSEFRNSGQRMSPASLKIAVYVVKFDGTGLKRISGDDSLAVGSAWSKDGARLFYTVQTPPTPSGPPSHDIASIGIDGTAFKALTTGGQSSSPSLSPNGEQIVYNCAPDPPKPQICVMNADGSGTKALTSDNTLAFYNPEWSPTGKTITYFVERGDNKDQIWTMNVDGSGATLLTNNIGHNFSPTWSADGRAIMFISNRDGAVGLYTVNADGSNLKRLPITGAYARFSPDGKKLAMVVGGRADSKVVVTDGDGTTNAKTILPK
jgi:TolB protein